MILHTSLTRCGECTYYHHMPPKRKIEKRRRKSRKQGVQEVWKRKGHLGTRKVCLPKPRNELREQVWRQGWLGTHHSFQESRESGECPKCLLSCCQSQLGSLLSYLPRGPIMQMHKSPTLPSTSGMGQWEGGEILKWQPQSHTNCAFGNFTSFCAKPSLPNQNPNLPLNGPLDLNTYRSSPHLTSASWRKSPLHVFCSLPPSHISLHFYIFLGATLKFARLVNCTAIWAKQQTQVN